jgi:hypothetical protein
MRYKQDNRSAKVLKAGIGAVMLFLFLTPALAQQNVGIGTTNPNSNAILQLVSPNDDQGFMLPGLSSQQRNNLASSLSSADNGLLVFDTDQTKFYYWQNDAWIEIFTNVPGAADGQILKYDGTRDQWVVGEDFGEEYADRKSVV